MKSVSISDLKAHLARYVRAVRRGRELLIAHRGVPVARLVPLEPVPFVDCERLARLVRHGVVKAPSEPPTRTLEPPLRLGVSLSDALAADRRGRG